MRKKNIVYYVTKQYMKQNKKRTFTTFLGIVFMVLLMTCVFVGKDTALKYLETVAEKNSGSWHYCAYDVNGKQYEKIKNLPSITETAVSEEIGFTEFKQSENEKRPYLNIKAYTENCFNWRNIELVSGRFPENEQELIISESAVEDGSKISIGDKVSAEFFTRSITGIDATLEKTIFPFFDFLELHYGETVDLPEEFAYYGESKSFRENKDMTGKKQDYTVVGFMKSPSHEFSFHAGYAALTYEEAPTTDCFNVTMKLNLKGENYADDIENQLKSIMGEKAEIESNSLLLAFSASTGDSTMDILVVFIQVFFVLLILVASMILIYNLFNMSFDERSKYLGMLSSVGATGKQKRSSVYFEAFYLLLYALPIGFLIGLGVIKLGMLAIRPYVGMLMELSGSSELANVSLVISGKSVAAVFIVCMVAVLVSAYLPARKIGKVGAIASIHGEQTRKKFYPTAWFAVKKGRPEALLAGNTIKRQKRKTKGIVGAAAVFMIIVIVTTFGATMVTKMIRYKMVDSLTLSVTPAEKDYYFCDLDDEDYESLKETIINDESVTDYVEWYEGMFFANTPGESYSKEYWNDYFEIMNLYYPEKLSQKKMDEMYKEKYCINVIAVDQNTYEKIAKASNCDMQMLAKENSAIVVQKGEMSTETHSVAEYEAKRYQFFEIEQMTDKKIGEEIPIEMYNSEKEALDEYAALTVAGYTTNEQLNGEIIIHDSNLWVIVNENTGKRLNDIKKAATGDSAAGMSRNLYFNVDSSGEDLIKGLEKMATQNADGTFIFSKLQNGGMGVTMATAINSVIEILAVCFVFFTSLLCMLNLYNAIRGRVEGRKKEFAIMASVGMTKQQMRKMLLFECFGILGKAVCWTVLFSTIIICGLWKILVTFFGHISFQYPWFVYLIAICLSGIIIFLITILCYNHQKTENIMDDIRTESV